MTLDIFIQTMIAEVQFHCLRFTASMVETFSDQTKAAQLNALFQ